jgi:hypothetical protein
MGIHKNSNENMDEHHLYEVVDSEHNTVFKYGICGKPLNSDIKKFEEEHGHRPRGNP